MEKWRKNTAILMKYPLLVVIPDIYTTELLCESFFCERFLAFGVLVAL